MLQTACDTAAAQAADYRKGVPPAQGRWTLIATILGSSLAFVDSTVVNVAIPSLARQFGAGAAVAQWTVAAYLLPLAAFVLVGGALGDRVGHRRIFMLGVSVFAVASLACGLSGTIGQLLAARAIQGAAAALFVPASLALLGTTFEGEARGKAIATWSAFGSVASAAGPLLGGWLVDHWSWRFAFFVNLPVAAVAIAITVWRVRGSSPAGPRHVDVAGALAAVAGLGALTLALTRPSGSSMSAAVLAGAGLAAFAGLIAIEKRSAAPMMPLDVWRSRLFASLNALTFVVYAGLSLFMFVLPIRLIDREGYAATAAAAALLPVTIELFFLSRLMGRWAVRAGPRVPLMAGAGLIATGFLLLAMMNGDSYWSRYLPGIAVLGFGLTMTVAPLTTAVVGALSEARTGLASGINNAVARTAGLAGVSAAALIAGAHTQHDVANAFTRIMLSAAALAMCGAAVAASITPAAVRRSGRREPRDGSGARRPR